MRYTVVLEREPDGGYVATVPALAGCVSQGDTRQLALENIREAIELYVEDCRDAGDPVPAEAGKEFVEVDPRLTGPHLMAKLPTGISGRFRVTRNSPRRA